MDTEPKARRPRGKAKPASAEEKPQRERFIEAARAVGVDETGEEFERAMKRLVKSPAAPKLGG